MTLKTEKITSRQNPKIKNIVRLQKHNERAKQELFIIEGIREFEKAIWSGYEFDSLFLCPEIADLSYIDSVVCKIAIKNIFEISHELFSKLAYRQDSGGILALAKPKSHTFDDLRISSNPLFVVIEGIEKPGNIGAIYRTADAAGISGIIICDPRTDFYNPNSVRASLGCLFTIPTVICNSKEAIAWLKKNNIQIFTSYLKATIPYHNVDFTKPSAIVMGTESTGISDIWLDSSDSAIIIPMKGEADSMNVSTAAAVLIFEACRQRDFK